MDSNSPVAVTKSEVLELLAEVNQLREALAAERHSQALMAAQFEVMQREKEHGWSEAEKQETRAERAEAALAGLSTETKKKRDFERRRMYPTGFN